MKTIELSLTGSVGYEKAEREARKVAAEAGARYSLMAWYDKAKGVGAPREACQTASWKCPRDYAEHHHADLRVSVNNDAYEFFFTRIPSDAEGLDSDEVTAVHKGISEGDFDNIQGG